MCMLVKEVLGKCRMVAFGGILGSNIQPPGRSAAPRRVKSIKADCCYAVQLYFMRRYSYSNGFLDYLEGILHPGLY